MDDPTRIALLQEARRYADKAHSRLVELGPVRPAAAEQLAIGARDRVDAD